MGNTNSPAGAGPVLVRQIDLDRALPALPDRTAAGASYRTALVTVKLHGTPVAVTEVQVTPGVATPATIHRSRTAGTQERGRWCRCPGR